MMYSSAHVDLQPGVCLDVWICLCRTASNGVPSADASSVVLSGLSGQLSTHVGQSGQQHLWAKQVPEDTTAGLRILDGSTRPKADS